MSSLSAWSYTAQATIWKRSGAASEYRDPVFEAPVVIACDYQGGLSKRVGDIGSEKVVKNTIWTEYALADTGDYILIGVSTEVDPIAAGADEIMQAIRYADTFDRLADDFAIITGA
ncbi:hypothetical protein [Pantoea sp. At-9b]|uniref:hypothetical protein n=1 Tax=Pantoea sp. (strain At-9b) TaxID=592316 RepID=UPI0001B3F1DA|nr:hypothetical protein [Pantoea sp. At-9b]ADU69432.1 conserved hypothetical protein [Pantoea sp. At-9b]